MSRTRSNTRPRLPQCSCGARHAPDTFACHSDALAFETRATGKLRADNDNQEDES